MNRLVIIGNGFDLAHNLPTSYGHFIDDFWRFLKENCSNENIKKLVFVDDNYLGIFDFEDVNNFSDFKKSVRQYSDEYGKINIEDSTKGFICFESQNSRKPIFKFENDFFRIINEKRLEKWVDIEDLYYKILKDKLNGNRVFSYYKSVAELNDEFEQVKNLLERYLIEKVEQKYSFDCNENESHHLMPIYNFLKPISLLSNEHNVLKEFYGLEDVDEIKKHFEKEHREELVNKLFFLNFNYTPTIEIYSNLLNKDDRIEVKLNYIHGELGNKTLNKLNFGFGDEMDDDYKLIENLDDNEYLKNFKSFQYLQNSNYSSLLSYVNSDKFQVIIIGHSCGLSDRTLLNTIFEHEHCRSIKVFYHQEEDENGDIKGDNYTDLVQNISRHFTDKKLMRSKLVNKELCKPLPQIQLPKKE